MGIGWGHWYCEMLFVPGKMGNVSQRRGGFGYWFQEFLLVTVDCTDCSIWKNFLATSCFFAKQTFNSNNEFFKSSEVQLSPNSQDPQSTGVHQILLMNTRDQTLGNFFHFFHRPESLIRLWRADGYPCQWDHLPGRWQWSAGRSWWYRCFA